MNKSSFNAYIFNLVLGNVSKQTNKNYCGKLDAGLLDSTNTGIIVERVLCKTSILHDPFHQVIYNLVTEICI